MSVEGFESAFQLGEALAGLVKGFDFGGRKGRCVHVLSLILKW
jgi:hypothetical protein